MIKVLGWLCIFLGVFAAYFYFVADYRKSKIETLKAEKLGYMEKLKGCEDEKNGMFNAAKRSEDTIGEIRTVIKTVKSPCACYDSRIDDAIFERVRGKK